MIALMLAAGVSATAAAQNINRVRELLEEMQQEVEMIEKRQAEVERHLRKFEEPELEVLNGRYGPYIAYKGNNYRLPKTLAERAKELTLEECMTVVKEQDEKPKTTARKRTYSKKK